MVILPVRILPANGEFFPLDLKAFGSTIRDASGSATQRSALYPGATRPRGSVEVSFNLSMRAGAALINEESFDRPMTPGLTRTE
jgi:hypothetical protein